MSEVRVMRLAAIACAVLGLGCPPEALDAPATEPDERGPLLVQVVNYPLQYFAERIGGKDVQVVFPVPPDVDPAFWSPDSDAVAAIQSADWILLNGAGYARWLARATLPRAKLVDTSAAFADRLIPIERGVTHQHGPQGDHTHRGAAFTTWLDPELAAEQATAIAAAFTEARPEQAAGFRERLAALEADLRQLDAAFASAAGALDDSPLLFSHPVYAYLERRYALSGRSLHWEADAAPSEKEWGELASLLEEHPARILVWEAEPLAETAERLEGLGLKSVTFAPCANRPLEGDWLAVMNENSRRLAAAGARGP